MIQEIITENGQEAFAKEKELIAEIGLENLCNLRDGGYKLSEETRKMSKSHKEKTLSEETKRKMLNLIKLLNFNK